MNQVVGSNIQYMRREGTPVFQVSIFVRFFCIITIGGYLLTFLERTVDVVSVTPGYLLPPSFSVWTLFTFFFIERHFWEVLVDVVTLGLCGKLIEPLWGAVEMLCFFLVCNLGAVILTTLVYLIGYMCTKNSELLFDVRIYGQAAYVAGVSVAVHQIMPQHPLVNAWLLGTLTNRNVPLLVLTLSTVLWLVGLLEGVYPIMFCSGILVAWIYLRFFQQHNNRRGDHSASFRFENFFPNVIQPFVMVVVNLLYILGLKSGIRNASQQEPLLPVVRLQADSSATDFVDVERRRQIALKALHDRLSSQKSRNKALIPPKKAKAVPEPSVIAGVAAAAADPSALGMPPPSSSAQLPATMAAAAAPTTTTTMSS